MTATWFLPSNLEIVDETSRCLVHYEKTWRRTIKLTWKTTRSAANNDNLELLINGFLGLGSSGCKCTLGNGRRETGTYRQHFGKNRWRKNKKNWDEWRQLIISWLFSNLVLASPLTLIKTYNSANYAIFLQLMVIHHYQDLSILGVRCHGSAKPNCRYCFLAALRRFTFCIAILLKALWFESKRKMP